MSSVLQIRKLKLRDWVRFSRKQSLSQTLYWVGSTIPGKPGGKSAHGVLTPSSFHVTHWGLWAASGEARASVGPVDLEAKPVTENKGHVWPRECGVSYKHHPGHPESWNDVPKVTQTWQSQHSNPGQSDSKTLIFPWHQDDSPCWGSEQARRGSWGFLSCLAHGRGQINAYQAVIADQSTSMPVGLCCPFL